jgi:hypothetical protein
VCTSVLCSCPWHSTPLFLEVMQDYYLKLLGRYRLFVSPAGGGLPCSPAAAPDEADILRCLLLIIPLSLSCALLHA